MANKEDIELERKIHREVIKAQYGTVGELTDAIYSLITQHAQSEYERGKVDGAIEEWERFLAFEQGENGRLATLTNKKGQL